MTADGLNTLTYDAENRVVTNVQAGATTNYLFDGSNLRVKKCAPNCTSPTSSTVYIFSGTKVLAEYDNGAAVASPTREYIYSASTLVAKIEAGATTYHHPDHLSTRVTIDTSGNLARTFGHYPFGENWYETGGANKLKFTTYARDNGTGESGNDYAMMRTSITRLARFSSPDPIAGHIGNPQSLNRYAYVLNDPPNLADPLGLVAGGPVCLLNDVGNCSGWFGVGGTGGTCYIDGFLSSCSMANALLQSGAGVAVPPGLALSGFINGHFYYLTAHGDEEGDYLSFNYSGLSAAQIEALGLPSTIDVLGFGGGGQRPGGDPVRNLKDKVRDLFKNKPKCAELFGGLKNALKQMDLARVYPPGTFNPSVPGSVAAAGILARYPHGAAYAGGNIFLGPQFFDQSLGAQQTIFIHELRHQAYNTGEPPITSPAYQPHCRREDAGIVTACGTEMPAKR